MEDQPVESYLASHILRALCETLALCLSLIFAMRVHGISRIEAKYQRPSVKLSKTIPLVAIDQ